MSDDQTVFEVRLCLPEPPSLNEMLELAMKRSRRTRTGGFTKKVIPGIVYDQHHETYELECLAAMRQQGVRAPRDPWKVWQVRSAEFRLHNLRDPIELLAGLKWPIDFLVHQKFAVDDGPKNLISTPHPTQVIDRKARGVTLVISGIS